MKLVHVLALIFIPQFGVRVRLTEFDDLNGEITDNLSIFLTLHATIFFSTSVVLRNKIQSVVSYWTDNANTKFGEGRRQGQHQRSHNVTRYG